MNIHCSRLLYLSGHCRLSSLDQLAQICLFSASPDSSPERTSGVTSHRLGVGRAVRSIPPPPYPCWAGFDGPFSPIGPRGPRPHAARPTHTPWDAPLLAGGGGIGCFGRYRRAKARKLVSCALRSAFCVFVFLCFCVAMSCACVFL